MTELKDAAALPAPSSDGLCERLEALKVWDDHRSNTPLGQLAAETLRSRDARIAELEAASIKLTPAEMQSGHDRVRQAEGLISQLPNTHDGRNSWLLNFGQSDEAEALRQKWETKFGPLPESSASARASLTGAR